MPEKEELEALKSDFLTKNAALIQAIKETTVENYKSRDNKTIVSSLRAQAVESYNNFLQYILKS